MPMTPRKKASDTFRDTTPIFSRKVGFQEAFPEIATLRVEVERPSSGPWSPVQKLTLTEKTAGEYVDCNNPVCYNGGVSIGSLVREAVRERRTEFGASKLCRGYEGSPQGRRKYRECLCAFKVQGVITYKSTDAS